jgi:ParB family chromosome partitioning protein
VRVGGDRPASRAGHHQVQEDHVTTTTQDAGRHVALDQIRVPDNVRALDDAHVQALAGSIALQGMLVPLVVRTDGDRFELVAGFHRIAAARSLGLADVPVVVRDAQTEDADRAVENITSCRRRHEVINADSIVMPTSELKWPAVRDEPGGEVGIRTRTDPGHQTAAGQRG